MSEQPLALRLADSADACQLTIHDCALVAAELRRLYAEVDSLSYRLAYPDNFARDWVGLTDEEIFEIHKQVDSMQYLTFGKAIEAKLREKNGGN